MLRWMKRNDKDSGSMDSWMGRVGFPNRPRFILVGGEAGGEFQHEDWKDMKDSLEDITSSRLWLGIFTWVNRIIRIWER